MGGRTFASTRRKMETPTTVPAEHLADVIFISAPAASRRRQRRIYNCQHILIPGSAVMWMIHISEVDWKLCQRHWINRQKTAFQSKGSTRINCAAADPTRWHWQDIWTNIFRKWADGEAQRSYNTLVKKLYISPRGCPWAWKIHSVLLTLQVAHSMTLPTPSWVNNMT